MKGFAGSVPVRARRSTHSSPRTIGRKNLQGQDGDVFTVTVQDVKAEQIPALDEEFFEKPLG